MRIHSSLTEAEIRTIAYGVPNVNVAHSSAHGSRKRAHGVEIRLHGSSPRRTMSNDGYAATWDEWGVFISRIFRADPNAIVGDYRSVYEFEEITEDRFTPEFSATPGHAHRWNFVAPFEFACKCEARMTTRPFMARI